MTSVIWSGCYLLDRVLTKDSPVSVLLNPLERQIDVLAFTRRNWKRVGGLFPAFAGVGGDLFPALGDWMFGDAGPAQRKHG